MVNVIALSQVTTTRKAQDPSKGKPKTSWKSWAGLGEGREVQGLRGAPHPQVTLPL